MTTPAVASTSGHWWSSPRAIGLALTVLVIAAIALDTTYRDADEPLPTASGRPKFDPESYGRETFPKITQLIEQRAQPLPQLLEAIADDPDAAGEEFGHREGNAPYSFAVSGEGIAGKPENNVVPVKVKGVPKDTQVFLQIGPALNGTAVRDATGEIAFGQFVNQVEFADAATALNNEVKAQVLSDVQRDSLDGKNVRFTGAFTYLAPGTVTITPVALEAA